MFNVFLNDLFLCLQNSNLHDFSNENTITATCENINDLPCTLEKEAEQAIDWFNNNCTIINPDKFQGIDLSNTNRLGHEIGTKLVSHWEQDMLYTKS